MAANDVEAEIHKTRGAGSRDGAPGLKAELIGGCAVNDRVVTLAEGCKILHRWQLFYERVRKSKCSKIMSRKPTR